MNYWRIKIDHGRGSKYEAYYKSPINLSLFNVPREAVMDGDLIDVDVSSVEKVEIISSEEYHTYMWE